MSMEGLGVALAIMVITVLWIASPLLSRDLRHAGAFGSIQRQRERLSGHYDRVLTNIRDLDEDFALGKLNPEDYQVERERWMDRGIQVLIEMDHSGLVVSAPAGDVSGPRTRAEVDASIDDQIERAVAEYRKRAEQ